MGRDLSVGWSWTGWGISMARHSGMAQAPEEPHLDWCPDGSHRSVSWPGMFGLVDADFAASGEGEGGDASPSLFAYVGDGHVFLFQMLQGCGDVVAHEEE